MFEPWRPAQFIATMNHVVVRVNSSRSTDASVQEAAMKAFGAAWNSFVTVFNSPSFILTPCNLYDFYAVTVMKTNANVLPRN